MSENEKKIILLFNPPDYAEGTAKTAHEALGYYLNLSSEYPAFAPLSLAVQTISVNIYKKIYFYINQEPFEVFQLAGFSPITKIKLLDITGKLIIYSEEEELCTGYIWDLISKYKETIQIYDKARGGKSEFASTYILHEQLVLEKLSLVWDLMKRNFFEAVEIEACDLYAKRSMKARPELINKSDFANMEVIDWRKGKLKHEDGTCFYNATVKLRRKPGRQPSRWNAVIRAIQELGDDEKFKEATVKVQRALIQNHVRKNNSGLSVSNETIRKILLKNKYIPPNN